LSDASGSDEAEVLFEGSRRVDGAHRLLPAGGSLSWSFGALQSFDSSNR
jgi:hypothetical protein